MAHSRAAALASPSALSDSPELSASASSSSAGRRDALQAVRNGVKLFLSALATGGIAVAMRFVVPAILGPKLYGPYTYAEAFTLMFFVFLGLGVDTYIRREVSVRPEHASEFFGGVLVVRLAMAVLAFSAMAFVLHLTGAPEQTRYLVYLFGCAQLCTLSSQSFAAMLQSKGDVNGLVVWNIVSKLLWAGLVIASLTSGIELWGLGAALFFAELVKAGALFLLAKKHLTLTFSVRLDAVRAAIVASLPFYLNEVAFTIYNKLDVNALEWTASALLTAEKANREVGYYGAAARIGDLTMYISPVIFSVLMPLLARAAARSQEEYTQLLRRALELILAVAVPTTLAVGLGADVWIRVIFGPDYAPAAAALRILAPLFILTYVAVVTAVVLAINRKPWAVFYISLCGLALNATLNATLIKPSILRFGEGGGGVGGALAQVGTELLVTTLLLWLVGRQAIDRRTLVMLFKTALVCAAVVALDRYLLALGPSRLLVDAFAYVVLILLVRAIPLKETADFLRAALRARKAT